MRQKPFGMSQVLLAAALFGAVAGGIVVLRTVAGALAEAGVDAVTANRVQGAVALAVVLLSAAGVAGAALLGRMLARPFVRIRAGILERARGDDAAPVPDSALAEAGALSSALARLAVRAAARESELQRGGAEIATLLDAISDGILQLDAEGRIVRANPAARALLRLLPASVGEPVALHVRHAELRRILERAAAGDAMEAVEVALEERRLFVSARQLPAHDTGAAGAVVAFTDLTELRRLESVRREFVANVSHELKTPLTSIRGYVETLLTDDLPPEMQRQFLDVVHKNADRLHHIVDDLLDLSRLESGGWRPELHDVNALDIVEDVWSSCAERAARRDVTFGAPNESLRVRADPGGLRQVLSNLLDNALRYTPDRGRVEVRTYRESAHANGNGTKEASSFVVFEVRDTGSGIPSEALPRIFERFYRVDPARSRAEGGTGLGLSIVKHLVESMGGSVGAESELGRGTIIRFRLPAAE
jgi:two-component system, OmpR family, phosphate regulon sensor histidine kinase PhoR